MQWDCPECGAYTVFVMFDAGGFGEMQCVACDWTEEATLEPDAVALGRKGGLAGGRKGGLARAAALTPEERRASARRAANARWDRVRRERARAHYRNVVFPMKPG